MRLHSCALTLVMILGLTVPCYGNDLNDCWEAARVATSGIAAAEHDHQLRLRASDDGGTRWDRLAEYLISQLELIGIEERRRDNLADVAAEHFPGLAQSTWHPLKAVLSDVLSGEELIRLETSPGCVAHPSSVAKLEADLVDVGVGDGPDSYLGKDVSGKLALASGDLAEVYREAVLDRGALGVISYFEDELDRGVLDPEQLPRQNFADGNTGSIRPGTFAMTVMQGTALDLRRALLRGQQVRLAVDIEVDLREAEVQVVSARLQPALDANEAEDVPPLLLFADLSVGAEISPVGGAAAMLEVVRTLIALMDAGNFELVRPVVFLWSSDPAAVRTYVSENDLAPVAAIELRDYGAGHVLNPVMHAVVPSSTHASWLTSWIGLALSQSLQYQNHTEADLGVEWIVREQVFPLDCDRFLLNREDVTFPTVLLSESPPCIEQQMPASALESSSDELRWKTLVAATLEVIRPLVTDEPPSDASLNRVAERLLTRYWQRAIGAFYTPGSAHQQDADSNEGRVRGLASLEDAREKTDAELEAWSDMLPEANLAELQLWIAAMDDLMRGRLQEAPQATAAAPPESKPSDAIVGPDTEDSPSTVSASRTTPAADPGVQRQPTPSPVKTTTPLIEPIATPTPALPRPTPQPRVVVPTPTAVPPTPVPDLPASTPTPAGINPMAVQADAYLVQGRRDLEDGNCESALAKLRRISDQTPEQHTQARALIATVEKRMETSRKAFSEGIGHLTERRQSLALAAFKRVEPCTADEYRQAQKRIQSIQEPASQSGGDGDCESLGVLRATRAQGDGRTVSGSLNIGEKAVYCFGAEMPGYGDLEVLVPMGFRAEGMGLIVAKEFKTFSGSDVRYVRYYAEKLTPGTRVEVTLHNKQSSTAEFECEFYLYPR